MKLFASHDWGEKSVNHNKVKQVVLKLRALGHEVWFDEDEMKGFLSRYAGRLAFQPQWHLSFDDFLTALHMAPPTPLAPMAFQRAFGRLLRQTCFGLFFVFIFFHYLVLYSFFQRNQEMKPFFTYLTSNTPSIAT